MGDEEEDKDEGVGEEVFAQAGLKTRQPQIVRRFFHFCNVSADCPAQSDNRRGGCQRLKAKEAAIVIQAVLELGHEILDSGAVASATKTFARFKRLPLRRPK
jgi:hypothetical protein